MTTNILNYLQPLQAESGKHLNSVALSYIQDPSEPLALVTPVMVANGNWAVKPKQGSQALLNIENQQSIRKVKQLSSDNNYIMKNLNTALLGGQSYPVLTAALGIAAGIITAGGSLLFTVATTALSLANTSQRVLARSGDEIWHIEEIGKVGNKVIHISSYFIVDPYRTNAEKKGWLISEKRREVILT